MSGFDIRPASAEDFAVAIDWAAAEGWNPGLDDMAPFHAADPAGFLLGWENGAPVGSISVARYGADYGFLGFYIVRPDRRGAGLGMRLWTAGLAHLAGRTVGLDGVVAQQENYRKSGFVLAGRNIRHTGRPRLPASAAAGIEDATPALAAAILRYDHAFFPAPRDAFTALWATPPEGARRRAKVALRDGALRGYGVIRACRAGYKIGPLFAEDEAAAESLLAALVETIEPEAEISLDTPEGNRAATALAERAGLEPSFETARMYRGPAPDLPWDRTYGVTTFELG